MDHQEDNHYNSLSSTQYPPLTDSRLPDCIPFSHTHTNLRNFAQSDDHSHLVTSFLSQKRESDNPAFSIPERIKQTEMQSKGGNEAIFRCTICNHFNFNMKKIKCSMCNRLYHLECALSRGILDFRENNFIQCQECKIKQKRLSNLSLNFGLGDIMNGSGFSSNNEQFNFQRLQEPSTRTLEEKLKLFNNSKDLGENVNINTIPITPQAVLNLDIPNLQKLQMLSQIMINSNGNTNRIAQVFQGNPMLMKIIENLNNLTGGMVEQRNNSGNNWSYPNMNGNSARVYYQNNTKTTNTVTNLNFLNNCNSKNAKSCPNQNQNPMLSFSNINLIPGNSAIINQAPGFQNFNQPKIQKYPIDDKLLLTSPALYDITLETFNRPPYHPLSIPPILANRLIIIWDFLLIFKEHMVLEECYISDDLEIFYTHLISCNWLFEQISRNLIHLLLKILNSLDIQPDEKDLFIAKALLDNPNSNINVIMQNCWKEFLNIILTCRKFNFLVTSQFQSIIENFNNTQKALSDEEKIQILFILVNTSFETQVIKTQIQTETQAKMTWEFEKSSYEDALRENEKRKKEILRSEKFHNAAYKIEMINKKLEDFNETNIHNHPLQNCKSKTDLEMERERYRTVIKENETLDNMKNQIVEKIEQIKTNLKNLKVTRKRLLGSDVYRNEYYFFHGIPNKIFIKEKRMSTWNYYDKKEEILDLIEKLLEKGIHEKRLKYFLKKTLTEKMNFENTTNGSEMPMPMPMSPPQVDPSQQISKILIKIEEKCSEYLSQFDKEWESLENRTKWKNIILSTSDINIFKLSLTMLHLRFKHPYKKNELQLNEIIEQEDNLLKFTFIDDNTARLDIYQFAPNRLLAPKVKIWSKDIEANGIDKYYSDTILPRINSIEKILFALYFFEYVVIGIIKRRETALKRNCNLLKDFLPANNEIENIEDEINEEKETIILNPAIEEIQPQINNINIVEPDDINIVEAEKTMSIKIPSEKSSSEKKQSSSKSKRKKKRDAIILNDRSVSEYEGSCTAQASSTRRSRVRRQSGLKFKKWKERCYICQDYGQLICCDGCNNVAHLFCACLSSEPDEWWCEKCECKKNGKKWKGDYRI